jgi:signal transduction histidine kinase
MSRRHADSASTPSTEVAHDAHLTAPARLAALHETALLDTPAEEAFDRLTRLAARLLRAPVALVTLVDEDRQFFKSCVGLPEPWASARETPLSHSFCQHAVQLRAPLVIEDARTHALVRDNLAIRDIGVVSYAGIPLATADGLVLGSFCVIDNVPRRWTADELATLADLAASAVTEIELRAALRSAETARARAAAADRAKDDFLALVSHELRTPLAGIASNAQMLAMGLCGPVTERQTRALQRISRSQEHLLGIIEQLLDLKRIASGHMEYELARVPLDEALGAAAALVDSHLEQLGLRFEPVPPAAGPAVRADRAKLQQILLNLLSNAAKFTPSGGTVTLGCEPGAGGDVRIHVRDTGIGIPADQLDAVFEPFIQVRDIRKPAAAGTGLGLAISRDLARGMGGDLTVESALGEGTVFTLVLPRD